MTPKVGPHRTFGFAPGTIFGHQADLIFRQGMLKCDNADLEFIAALSGDKKTLYLLAINQSPDMASGTLGIDLSKLSARAKWTGERVLQGAVPVVTRPDGRMNLTLPAWGMQVIALELAGSGGS
jgi:hypothetical protein